MKLSFQIHTPLSHPRFLSPSLNQLTMQTNHWAQQVQKICICNIATGRKKIVKDESEKWQTYLWMYLFMLYLLDASDARLIVINPV